jgi:hypothetical protein
MGLPAGLRRPCRCTWLLPNHYAGGPSACRWPRWARCLLGARLLDALIDPLDRPLERTASCAAPAVRLLAAARPLARWWLGRSLCLFFPSADARRHAGCRG